LVAHETTERFESTVLVHLDAAYNLARWLNRNDQDAQDVVQDACVRAFRLHRFSLRGGAATKKRDATTEAQRHGGALDGLTPHLNSARKK